jgi:hypothetical protein
MPLKMRMRLNSAHVAADDSGMNRLLVVVCAAALLVGCAKVFSSALASEAQATPPCGAAGTPPAPLVRADREGYRVLVEYDVARPAGCAPDAVVITVRSAAKPENVGPSTTNGLIRLSAGEGRVELDLPPLDLPPYEVQATSLTPRGRRSATTTVRLGDPCRGERCVERAQEKLERCMRGIALREACPAYVWRTRPAVPYEPVEGVTRESLERSFTTLAGTPVVCASTRECVIDGMTFAVSGYHQRPGCWIAEHRLLRHRACVDWKWSD